MKLDTNSLISHYSRKLLISFVQNYNKVVHYLQKLINQVMNLFQLGQSRIVPEVVLF